MKTKISLGAIVLLIVIQINLSCKKETSCEGCIENNKPPIAIAGPDQVITLPTDSVSLDGSTSSDPDGTISNWLWTRISGPASFIINNSSSSKSGVRNLVKGLYQFELKITDNAGLSAKDTMQVIVNDLSQPNRPPVANAGADQTITLPTNTTILDGSGSTDPDNNITSYQWTKISGPLSYNVTNAMAVQTQVANLIEGVYKFELKVMDAGGLFAIDTIQITVVTLPQLLPCDSSSNSWTQLQSLPPDEFFFGSYTSWWFQGHNFLMDVGDKIYAVSHFGHLWQYNVQGNTWLMMGDFPENLSTMSAVFSVNGKGYCIGNGHCWEYSPASNQWLMKNDPPGFVYAPLVSSGKVYLKNSSNQIVEYDPASDTYAVKSSCPSNQSLLGWFVINNKGFHVYGDGQCWKYDPITDNWQQKASLILPGVVHNTSSFSLNSSGYIIGDLNFQSYNNHQPMLVLKYNSTMDKWTHCASENYPGNGAYAISTVSFSGIVFVGLGYNNGDVNAVDFWKFQ